MEYVVAHRAKAAQSRKTHLEVSPDVDVLHLCQVTGDFVRNPPVVRQASSPTELPGGNPRRRERTPKSSHSTMLTP
jgi:hypothetical protein